MNSSRTWPTMISRERKILRISQAHVAAGMNLGHWRAILTGHGVDLAAKNPWPFVDDRAVDSIFDEIAGIVEAAREVTGAMRQSEVFEPVDLYRVMGGMFGEEAYSEWLAGLPGNGDLESPQLN
jgi:hypothetical protein